MGQITLNLQIFVSELLILPILRLFASDTCPTPLFWAFCCHESSGSIRGGWARKEKAMDTYDDHLKAIDALRVDPAALASRQQKPRCRLCRLPLIQRRALASAWLGGENFMSLAREYCVSAATVRKHLLRCEMPNVKLAQRHLALNWSAVLSEVLGLQNDLMAMAHAQIAEGQCKSAVATVAALTALTERRIQLAALLQPKETDLAQTQTDW